MGDDWVNGVNLLEIKDELTLHEMLDRSEDYEDRKKVRSRLKDVIAASRAKREELISHREADREEVLRARVRDADENKRRTLAMYDAMAKSAPAGGNKTMDINILREGKSSTPSTPGAADKPAPRVDLVEQAIRQRQADADDRKKRTLMAYDNAAKSGPAGAARFIDFEAVIKKEDPNKRISPRERFQRMDSLTAPPVAAVKLPTSTIPAKPVAAGLVRSPTAIKEMLLNWAKSKTKEYENVTIDNFSTSWNDGMAFCALVHHFYPDAFDFQTLSPKNRRFNFDLAFRVAEEKGDVAPLLDVEDMVVMKKPDWKCVFTYVQSLYRKFHTMD